MLPDQFGYKSAEWIARASFIAAEERAPQGPPHASGYLPRKGPSYGKCRGVKYVSGTSGMSLERSVRHLPGPHK